ncbi:hypothetical protein [Nonomuraea aridisoli]|uniref:Uncharacterized protein n=1 Tax=Nonomuraea aridisoli TaxID=2070368 RepID=A0A2W2DTE5_9ACTN|nr:hypothetical protein [Nonomuraea aridisoli]PZG03018.1 hypothetical protein C1J01_46845 [Nonomuraea aridisoli]
MSLIIDTTGGRQWAAHIEQSCKYWWLVLWEPGRQRFTAYYRGPWKPGGVYRTGTTPEELWTRIVATQAEGRRHAAASASTAVPPLLPDELPVPPWKAAG